MNGKNDQVSAEKNSSFHEEKVVEKQPFDPELEESIESKIDRVLKGESVHKKVNPVSVEKSVNSLEEKVVEKQPLLFSFQCMECGNMPFSVGEVISDKTGITCPHCKHVHSITANRKGSDDQILFRCMRCNHSFGSGESYYTAKEKIQREKIPKELYKEGY